MDKNLEMLDDKGIFKYFCKISEIPRGSGNELEISNYLVAFAKEHGLEYTQDVANNVIMIKNASPGYENEPAIILQGHMDMVCEKKKESTIDFLKDRIKPVVEGDFLHADGTTLGADNGIAVAYILALFSDEAFEHPRLEAIFTTDEEVGMHGAKALELSALQGKYMINLDSEEEGYLLCSCAGGLRGTSTIPLKRVSEYGKNVKVSIGGLKGGHSGVDIVKNRTNASKLMGRLLFDLRDVNPFGLIDMVSGYKDNVIPREADAKLFITASDDNELARGYLQIKRNIESFMMKYQQELFGSEPDLNFKVEDMGNDSYEVLHPVSFEKVLFMLVNMPYGVQVMSSNIEGLVESSLNLGIFHLEEDKAVFANAVRSSLSTYKKYLSDQLDYMANFLGGGYRVTAEYPAWEFKRTSPLREHFKKLYHQLYQKDMKVEAIHAGLECGMIHEKIPGIDIVSIGPDIFGVHTIEEKISIPSAIRVYEFLELVIKEKIIA